MDHVFVEAGDGTRVPLTFFAAEAPRTALLMMPALGIQARLYFPLGQALSADGCAVAVLEQRGHGRSPLKVGRGSRFGMADFLQQDIPAALRWLQGQVPDLPLLLAGHSLGGHLATLYSQREPARLAGIVHIATAFPYHVDYPPRRARQIRMLCRLVTLSGIAPGYFPGHWIGFGGRESLQLMRDWRDWARTGRFAFGDHPGLPAATADYRGPVMSISLAKDDYSCPAAVDRALSPLRNSRITRVELGTDEQGDFLGHFQWARQPAGVARAISAWIGREVRP